MNNIDLNYYIEHIPDEYIRLYIFGKKNPSFSSTNDYYKYINNLINLIFMYVYCCYRYYKDNELNFNEKIKGFNANSKRIIKTLNRIYSQYDISFEIINYVLLDLQFDICLGYNSSLKSVIPSIYNPETPLNILKFTPKILHWMKTARPEEDTDFENIKDLFSSLIDMCPFLKDLSLQYNEDIDDVMFVKNGIYYPSNKTIYIHDCGRNIKIVYFLEKINIKENEIILNYSTIDYAQKYNVYIVEDIKLRKDIEPSDGKYIVNDLNEEYLKILDDSLELLKKNKTFEKNKNGIANVYTINYKYMKNLSLAISDEIGKQDHQECYKYLFDRFYEDYPNSFIFYINNDKRFDNCDWDSTIVMLLIEVSPRTILKEIFLKDSAVFHLIIQNLYKRFNKNIDFPYVDLDNDSYSPIKLNNYLDSLIQTREIKYYSRDNVVTLAEIKADYIISVLLKKNKESSLNIVDSLNKSIKQITNSRIDIDSKCNETEVLLSKVLEKLICFYHGVLAYGQVKGEYDIKSYNVCLSEDIISNYQNAALTAFYSKAKSCYETMILPIKTSNIDEYLKKIIELFIFYCKQFESNNDSSQRMRINLENAIGKKRIIDLTDLNLSIELLNLEKITRIDAIKNILEYINTGSFEKNENYGDFNNVIFPIIGNYGSMTANQDGYRTVNFYIKIDVDSSGEADYMKMVNVLTEFSYDISEKYYCLPNIIRSNNIWWIDPVIISCNKFNDIFKKGEC